MSKSALKPGIFRWLTVGVAAYFGWLIANLVLAAIFPVLFLMDIAGGSVGRRLIHGFGVWFLGFFFLGYFPLIGVYRVRELPDPKRLASLGPCIFAANHRSWIDALVLTALIPGVRIPVNAEYTRVPLSGQMMRWLGCVPLDRKSRESIAGGVAEIRQILKNGDQVAVFPEGTRSPIGRLKVFSDFFFKVAIDENVPVVPILIHTDLPFLGPKSENFLTACPAVLKIRMLNPVQPEKGDRGSDLGRRIHKQMSSELVELDAGTNDSRSKDV
ncbi:MAG: 1-acyl-sn-glycerol-3-phosphate acyltransferase [Proteobacteria bacterium]|nr:1-acyl-sn-glycerol-3-phosphate acyltransferase [Pseudomonadota bacterium]